MLCRTHRLLLLFVCYDYCENILLQVSVLPNQETFVCMIFLPNPGAFSLKRIK